MDTIDLQTTGMVLLMILFISLLATGEEAVHDTISDQHMILSPYNDSQEFPERIAPHQ